MATIHYRTLNMQLKRAIVNRSLSEDQLREAAENVKAGNKKTMKTINIAMIICAVIFLIMFVPVIRENGDPKFIGIMLAIIVGSLAFVYAIIYELMVGVLKGQFNKAVKKGYPEMAKELKV